MEEVAFSKSLFDVKLSQKC